MQIVYTENARKRIGKLGATAISAFLDELPAAQRGRVLAGLPRMQGFRKNSPLEVKERAKTFVNAISHAADHKFREHDIEWKAFTVAWLCWVKNRFSVDLGEFDGESQLELAQHVISTAGELNCAREDLEKLLLFSYFPDDTDGAKFIAARPAEDELRGRRQVAELPSRVDGMSQRLDDLISRVAQVEQMQQQAAPVNVPNEAITALEEHLNAIGRRLGVIEERDASLRIELETAIQSLRSAMDTNGALVRECHEHTEGATVIVKGISREVPELRHSLNNSLLRLDELSKQVAEISAQNVTQLCANEAPSLSNENFERAVAIVQPAPDSPIKTLDGIASIVQLLADNFRSVGLEREDAESAARIVGAGLVAGQLVNFSGSLADLLADATCSSISGIGHVECDVPIGLCDGAFVSTCEERLSSSPRNSALVLRGTNRSAFEVYGAGIRSQVIGRQIGRPDRFEYRALIATSCVGPSVLDANESTLALGPVIDSDHLRWGIPKWKKIRLGALHDLRLQDFYKQYDDMPDLLNRISVILDGEQRTPALRRAVLIRAASALELIPDVDDSVRLELLLASWVVPYLRSQSRAEDSIRKRVDQVLKSAEQRLNLLSIVLEAGHEA